MKKKPYAIVVPLQVLGMKELDNNTHAVVYYAGNGQCDGACLFKGKYLAYSAAREFRKKYTYPTKERSL